MYRDRLLFGFRKRYCNLFNFLGAYFTPFHFTKLIGSIGCRQSGQPLPKVTFDPTIKTPHLPPKTVTLCIQTLKVLNYCC